MSGREPSPMRVMYTPYVDETLRAPHQRYEAITTVPQYTQITVPSQEVVMRQDDTIRELEHRNNVLRMENENLQQDLRRVTIDLANYKETMKKFYTQYVDQSKELEVLKLKSVDQNHQHVRISENQYEMKNDVKNLILDRDLLINKLEMGDKQYQHDIGSLTAQINDKNHEMADLRRRVNDLLEVKRKAEEEVAALRFTLDHQNTKLETELREKSIKLEQVDRQYADALYLKDRELAEAIEKIRGLEHEIRRILDLNRNYAQELSMLARDNRFKQDEINRATQPQQSVITVNSGSMEPRLPPIWQQKLHDKIDSILDLYDKSHKRQLAELAMNLWKCKTELMNRQKQNKSIMGENKELYDRKGTPALGKGSIDFRVSTVLCDGTITVLTFTRAAINNIIFELFVRSVNHSNQRKLNSFIIFILNLKELRQRYWKGLVLVLEVYAKLRKCLRHAMDYVLEARVQNGMYQKLQMAIGKLLKHDMDFRDNVNKWLEGTLAFTIQKKHHEKSEKNQDFLFLFRLLTVKYRIMYPLRGQTFKVDADIETFLEHKICYALRRILRSEPEEQT